MNEDEVRALAREEIRNMLVKMAEAADSHAYGAGELGASAAYVVAQLASGLVSDMEPEPVNPFAPKHTAQEWADRIKDLIRQAEADGYPVWDDRTYADSGTILKIGTPDSPPNDDPVIWREK